VDERSRTVPEEPDVANRDDGLSPGSFASVRDDGTKLSNTFRFVDRSDQRSSAHFVIRLRDNKADIEVFVNPKAGDQLTKTASDAEHMEDTVRIQSSTKGYFG
jgi:hypothetical protein